MVDLNSELEDLNSEMMGLAEMFFDNPDSPTYHVEFLEKSKLDYSLKSLDHLVAFLDIVHANINSIPEKKMNPLILKTGAYLGEVIRRNTNSKEFNWLTFERAVKINPQIESMGESISTVAILFDLKSQLFFFPLGKVLKYIHLGSSEDIKGFVENTLSAKPVRASSSGQITKIIY
jgi:hypothetical protein